MGGGGGVEGCPEFGLGAAVVADGDLARLGEFFAEAFDAVVQGVLIGAPTAMTNAACRGRSSMLASSWRLYSASWRQVAMSSASPLRTSRRWVNWSSMLPLARSLRTNSISRLTVTRLTAKSKVAPVSRSSRACRNSDPGNTMPALGMSTTGRIAW